MIVQINGEKQQVEEKINLRDLAQNSPLPLEMIVIEHNFRIVPKEEWGKIILQENDLIEILSFLGGG